MSNQGQQEQENISTEWQSGQTTHGGIIDAAEGMQEAVKESTKQAIDTATHTAQEIAQETAQQATDVVANTADQLSNALSDAKSQATSAFTKQRDTVITSLGALADVLREAGDRLSEKSTDDGEIPASIGPMVQDASNLLSQSATFLREKDITSLLKEARDLAQRQPTLFIGAMFAVGMAGARILKETTDGTNGDKSSGNSHADLGPMRQLPSSPGTDYSQPGYQPLTADRDISTATQHSAGATSNWTREGVQK